MPYILKGCPRCVGDLFSERSTYGTIEWCIQCSYEREIIEKKVPNNGNQSLDNLLDTNIEILEILEHDKQPLSVSTISRLFDQLDERTIEKCLEKMKKYGYASNIKNYEQTKSNTFEITPKGNIVVQDYWNLINEIEETSQLNGDKSAQFSTYKLVDKNGELTVFGRYALKISEVLCSFVEDVYQLEVSESEEDAIDKEFKSLIPQLQKEPALTKPL